MRESDPMMALIYSAAALLALVVFVLWAAV
jgi:hypothetical protein